MKFVVENIKNPNEPREILRLNVLLAEMVHPVFQALEIPEMHPAVHGALYWQLHRRPGRTATSGDWRVRRLGE